MIKKVLLFLLVLVAGFAAFVATRPETLHVERSVTIAAAPAAIRPHLEDFRAWAAWSPWEDLDPAMKKTFEGPASGTGSSYGWEGNDKVGRGRQTITEVVPDRRIEIRLELIEPWAATYQTAFAFAPEGDGTRVTWSMDGRNDYLSKAFGLFMDMDKMLGTDLGKGLAKLESLVEAEAAAAAPADSATAP